MLRLLFEIAHGFTHPIFQDVIPQIEIDFTTIQLAIDQWGVDNRVSCLSKLFSIIVTVSDLLSVFVDR